MKTYEPSQPKDYEQMELIPLTSFAAASPVNRFPLPGSSKAVTITATSGRKCSALCKSSTPLGSLVKMLLVSSKWHSMTCVLTWKTRVTKCNRLLFLLVPSMPLIGEIEFGLWPTPKAGNCGMSAKTSGRSVEKSTHLTTQVALSLGMIGKNGKLMPTPTAQDAKNSTLPVSQRDRDSIPGQLLRDGHTGQLNPQWVEWLMGYPEGWTDLNV